jgi:hypothetical protein
VTNLEQRTDPNPTGDADTVIHVIESSYHYTDADGRPAVDHSIEEDEGWFANAESATIRSEQLNAQNRALYDVEMDRRKRERDAKILAAETSNREAAVLRANGFEKADVRVPEPFESVPYEQWRPDRVHTTFAVIEMKRSDHDGIARAERDGAEGS